MATPTWFITGASSGFGMAFARYAIARGYNVVATARMPAKLEPIRVLAPERVLIEKLDVTGSERHEAGSVDGDQALRTH
jgi:NADP-dependent 3-hydroxy acid dehydrogenase YdfG